MGAEETGVPLVGPHPSPFQQERRELNTVPVDSYDGFQIDVVTEGHRKGTFVVYETGTDPEEAREYALFEDTIKYIDNHNKVRATRKVPTLALKVLGNNGKHYTITGINGNTRDPKTDPPLPKNVHSWNRANHDQVPTEFYPDQPEIETLLAKYKAQRAALETTADTLAHYRFNTKGVGYGRLDPEQHVKALESLQQKYDALLAELTRKEETA